MVAVAAADVAGARCLMRKVYGMLEGVKGGTKEEEEEEGVLRACHAGSGCLFCETAAVCCMMATDCIMVNCCCCGGGGVTVSGMVAD